MIDTTYSCDTIALDKSMGKVYLNPIDKKSIERRDKMTKETNDTIQSINHLDSLKAVKVAIEMNELQDVTIEKLVNLVASMDKNMKLLATKVLELEKKLEAYEQRKN